MADKKTVVVTGASGLLGRAIFKTFKDSGKWGKVIGTAFSRYSMSIFYIADANTVSRYVAWCLLLLNMVTCLNLLSGVELTS